VSAQVSTRAWTINRSELGLWLVTVLIVRSLVGLANDLALSHIARPSIFHALAWCVAFRLLFGYADDRRTPHAGDFAVVLAVSAICALPDINSIWIAVSLASVYFLLDSGASHEWRSAGTVLAALTANALWAPLLFGYLSPVLLRIDTALVAWLLQSRGQLRGWHDNIVSTGAGTLEIFSGCSSFHNISLALLGYVTITKLARPNWRRSDLAIAATCVIGTFTWNTLRMYLLATAPNSSAFEYWHMGIGSQIFSTVLGFAVALVATYGAMRPARDGAR
jgi:exosortase/archaeosortase family protein